MEKVVFVFVFYFLSSWCFAEEGFIADSNNESSPYFSYSFPSSELGYSIGNCALGTGSLVWERNNFNITKYSDDFEPDYSFVKKTLGIGMFIIGVGVFLGGTIYSATSTPNDMAQGGGLIIAYCGAGLGVGGFFLARSRK